MGESVAGENLKLPKSTLPLYTNVKIMGFGSVGWDRYSNVMMEADVSIRHDKDCLTELGSYIYKPDNNICVANKAGSSACQGDYGGPLVWKNVSDDKNYLIGVVSGSRQPCHHFGYTVCVNVFRALDFIEHSIKKLTHK